MPKDAYINTRVDKDLKAKAEAVLKKVGVSTSDVVTMLLHQIVLQKGVPFDVRVPNKETRAAINEARQGRGSRRKGKTGAILKDALSSND